MAFDHTGKTFALAKRYVQLLLSSALEKEQIPIRHILAVTFTNKAAFEMKARILDFLKRTALKALTAEEEKDILDKLCKLVVGREKEILNLADKYLTLKDLLEIKSRLIVLTSKPFL